MRKILISLLMTILLSSAAFAESLHADRISLSISEYKQINVLTSAGRGTGVLRLYQGQGEILEIPVKLYVFGAGLALGTIESKAGSFDIVHFEGKTIRQILGYYTSIAVGNSESLPGFTWDSPVNGIQSLLGVNRHGVALGGTHSFIANAFEGNISLLAFRVTLLNKDSIAPSILDTPLN